MIDTSPESKKLRVKDCIKFNIPCLRRLGKRDPGQSLVELALTLPLLFLILFGVIDLGRLYSAHVTITNASREGARYGMTNTTGIANAAVNEAGGLISTGDVLVECASTGSYSAANCAARQPGDRLRVTVTYTFHFVTLYILGLSQITLSDNTIMAIVK